MKFGIFERVFGGKQPSENAVEQPSAAEKQDKQAAEANTPPAETSPRRKYESPPQIKSPQEDVLTSREETSRKKIGRGVTDADFVELKDDGKGVFKAVKYERERAAYLIDRFLGFNLVPPTVIRQIGDQIGSMQEFIPDAKMATMDTIDNVLENYATEMIKMWLFDVIVKNIDRNNGNFLVKEKAGENGGGRIYAIDHGYSMHDDGYFEKEIGFCRGQGYKKFLGKKLPDEIVTQMKKFLENTDGQKILEDLLAELLGKKMARAVVNHASRVAKLVSKKGLIPKEFGEPGNNLKI